MIPRGLTIAGSDSGGGAGIQADIKTMESLGVYAMSVITSVTAQNTTGVLKIQDIEPDTVSAQIDAVFSDIGVDAAKTGMLSNEENIKIVAKKMDEYSMERLIVDPVMVAKSGTPLIKESAISIMKEELIPRAYLLTPNVEEAEVLAEMKISSVSECIEAAREISDLGVENVLIKGGHLSGEYSSDILYKDGEIHEFREKRIVTENTHGTGCTLSAAITAYLAKGEDILNAVRKGKEFVTRSLKYSLPLGKGNGPVYHLAYLMNESKRYEVLKELREGIKLLETNDRVMDLIPEVGSNLVYALPYAMNEREIAGIEGRIVKIKNGVKAVYCPWFDVSRHMAKALLAMRKYTDVKAAMNIKYSERIVEVCEKMGLSVSFFDRKYEPEEIKRIEGKTTEWGIEYAVSKSEKLPNVVCDLGEVGKEKLIMIFSHSIGEMVNTVINIAERVNA